MAAGVSAMNGLLSYGMSQSQILNMFDKDKNGQIDKDEQEYMDIAFKDERTFDIFDKNHDGKYDEKELEYMSKMLGTIDKQMEMYDKDNSHTIDKNEADAWSKQWQPKCNGGGSGKCNGGEKPFQVNVDNVFSAYDLDESGDLDYYEMLSMYTEFDVDGDGELSKEEAMAMDEALAQEGFTEDGEPSADGQIPPAAGEEGGDIPPPPPPEA